MPSLIGNFYGLLAESQSASPQIRGGHESVHDPYLRPLLPEVMDDDRFLFLHSEGVLVGRGVRSGTDPFGRALAGVWFGAMKLQASDTFAVPGEALGLAGQMSTGFTALSDYRDVDAEKPVASLSRSAPTGEPTEFWSTLLHHLIATGKAYIDAPAGDADELTDCIVSVVSRLGPLARAGNPFLFYLRSRIALGTPPMRIEWPQGARPAPSIIVFMPTSNRGAEIRPATLPASPVAGLRMLASLVAGLQPAAIRDTELLRASAGRSLADIAAGLDVANEIADHLSRALRGLAPAHLHVSRFVHGESELCEEAAAGRAQRLERFFGRTFDARGSEVSSHDGGVVLDLADLTMKDLHSIYVWAGDSVTVRQTAKWLFEHCSESLTAREVTFLHVVNFVHPSRLLPWVEEHPDLLRQAFERHSDKLRWYLSGTDRNGILAALPVLAAAAPSTHHLVEVLTNDQRAALSADTWKALAAEAAGVPATAAFVVDCLLSLPEEERERAAAAVLAEVNDTLLIALGNHEAARRSFSAPLKSMLLQRAIQCPAVHSDVAAAVLRFSEEVLTDEAVRWAAMHGHFGAMSAERRMECFFPWFADAVAARDVHAMELAGEALPSAVEVDSAALPTPGALPPTDLLFSLAGKQLEWALMAWSFGERLPADWELLRSEAIGSLTLRLLDGPDGCAARTALRRPRCVVLAPLIVLAGRSPDQRVRLDATEASVVEQYISSRLALREDGLRWFRWLCAHSSLAGAAAALWRHWVEAMLPFDASAERFYPLAATVQYAVRHAEGELPLERAGMEAEVVRRALDRCVARREPCQIHRWLLSAELPEPRWLERWWARARLGLPEKDLLSEARTLGRTLRGRTGALRDEVRGILTSGSGLDPVVAAMKSLPARAGENQ